MIEVINEEGREINPHPKMIKKSIGHGAKSLYDVVNEQWVEFENSIEPYSAPGIPNGKYPNLRLVDQYVIGESDRWSDIRDSDLQWLSHAKNVNTRTIYVLVDRAVDIHEQLLIRACKYGYDYHMTTKFPDMSFEENCKNNFLTWLRSDSSKEDSARPEEGYQPLNEIITPPPTGGSRQA